MEHHLVNMSCLTCLQQPDENDLENICRSDLREIMRKHFWFSDAELIQAWICDSCWESISLFHQFYVDVERLYETKPVPELEAVTVKEEKELTQFMLVEEIKEEELSDDMPECENPEDLGEEDGLYVEVEPNLEEAESDSDETMSVENEEESESSPLSETHPDNIIRKHVNLTCDDCDDGTSFTFKEFAVHAEKVHGNTKPFVMCCGSKYIKRCFLLDHVRHVMNPDAFQCKNCDEAFANGAALKRHLRIRHGQGKSRKYNNENRKDKNGAEELRKKREELDSRREQRKANDKIMLEHVKFECVPCGESFISFTELHVHSTSKHRTKPVITCCGNRYNSRCKLWQHVTSVRNPVAFRCELCLRCFKSEYAKDLHRRKMHPTEEELKFKCDRCDKPFSRELAYRRHMQDHEDSDHGRIKCEECGKHYKSHAVLYVHMRKSHAEPRFVCDICAKPFRLMSEFKNHKLAHEDPDKLKMQCPICMKWYKTREYWRAHIRLTHQSKGTVQCEVCDKTFNRKSRMLAHMKNVHTKPTKECEYCGKCFTKDINLREHVASQHTGDILYTCPFCPKTFNSNANMYSHKRKMHPVEWLEANEQAEAARQRADVVPEWNGMDQ